MRLRQCDAQDSQPAVKNVHSQPSAVKPMYQQKESFHTIAQETFADCDDMGRVWNVP